MTVRAPRFPRASQRPDRSVARACSAYADRSDRNGCDSATRSRSAADHRAPRLADELAEGRSRLSDLDARNTLDQSGYSLSRFESETSSGRLMCRLGQRRPLTEAFGSVPG